MLKRGTDYGDLQMGNRVVARGNEISCAASVLCIFIVSISDMGFGVFEYWKLGVVSYKSVLCVMTWFIATVVANCSKNRTHRGLKRWSLVLILWWIFSFTMDLFCISLYLITHLRFIKLPHFLPEAIAVEFVVFIFLMVLLFLSALLVRYARRYSEFESPLLQNEDGKSSKDGSQIYPNAGVWSKLTFRWLNPLFAKGRVRKLELTHILSIPQSETAESASLLLEESLRKQNTVTLSLPQVIAYAIWKSLGINAVYAALTVSIYKKSLSIKFAGPSSDTITNMINVDVERIGDFCWYIHEIWLLPVQVFLAVVVLHRNLGAAISIAVLFGTWKSNFSVTRGKQVNISLVLVLFKEK